MARDTSHTISGTGTAVTTTVTLTGSNITGVMQFENITDGTDSVSSVTMGGVSATQVNKFNTNGGRYAYTYIASGIPSGSQAFTINSGSSINYLGVLADYTGTNTSVDAHNYTSGNGSPATHSVTPVASNCWAILTAQNSDGQWTAGTGSNSFINDAGSSAGIFDSNGTITAGNAYSMTLTQASLRDYIWSQLTLKPSGGTTYTLTTAATSFSYTTQSVGDTKKVFLPATPANFIFTGLASIINKIHFLTQWNNQNKNSTNWTNQNKDNTNWTNQTRN